MARRPPPRRKVHRRRRRGLWSRLFRWTGRGIAKRARRRWQVLKRRVALALEAKVVKNWKNDHWKDAFPDPRHPKPFTMTRVNPADCEEYLATFDGLLTLEFWIEPNSGAALVDAAYEAAERKYGPISASWVLTSIEGTNDAGRAVLSAIPGGIFRP